MDFLPWKESVAYNIGAELEVRLHEEGDMHLISAATLVLDALPLDVLPCVHPEYLASLLALKTPLCASALHVREALEDLAQKTVKCAASLGAVVATSGVHALPCDDTRQIGALRDDALACEYGILLRKFTICGLHLQVSLPSSDDALRAYNVALEHLPVFIALGANSAFFDGEETGLLGYRSKLFEQLPLAGMPDYFEEYYEMGELYRALFASQSIGCLEDVKWEVRLNPLLGALEMRACDASNDFMRIELLGVLFQALCVYAQHQGAQWFFRQILEQNRWNAIRYGLEGAFQTKNDVQTLRVYARTWIKEMERLGIFAKLGTQAYVPKLLLLLEHPTPAHLQKECFEKHRCLSEVERLGLF
ncbi:hypothetical protein JWV37_10870 [Sulfurospirillum sp. T05]|uniref:Glutamate--cysteine ligase n=1 Tax=Sulfurospirillum tamanense TaxID=2813362 RepID=A0ABS2WUK5_9BACT|nr:glutamate-cysteine ligase family protein [Sulfurospirillum tamanensis]MBN2965285.1 hypothetical protein [Sulfurospirillum tamanensis]